MNEPAANFQRQKNAALTTLLGMSFVLGILEAAFAPPPETGNGSFAVQLFGSVILLLIGFYWLHFDSRERDITRPAWLNIGIVLLAVVFVPYYLYKTRPDGGRAVPIYAFFGLVLASALLSTIGALLTGAPLSNAVGA